MNDIKYVDLFLGCQILREFPVFFCWEGVDGTSGVSKSVLIYGWYVGTAACFLVGKGC